MNIFDPSVDLLCTLKSLDTELLVMEAAPVDLDNSCDDDTKLPAAYLRLVDSRISDQPIEEFPI